MPRDPKDISLSSPQRISRRIAEAHDIKEPAFLRAGSGPAGAEGPTGKDGATWYKGSGVPELALGKLGDFYFRTGTSDIYYKESESLWTIIANIKGEKGETGATGAAGKEGPAGSAENIDWKNSVRAATTANITISTALNNGDTLDGVVLATNDRVLVKDQTTKSQNGIYTVSASPARALDADAAAELSGGSTIYVEEGTKNKRRTFQIITAGNITPGTTAHEYQQMGGRDFGIVEELPTAEAVKNDKCSFKAAAGVYWDLIYTGEETYPWAKVGGPALHAFDLDARGRNNTAYGSLPTDPIAITLPLAGDYDIEIGAEFGAGFASVGFPGAYYSYSIGETAANDNWAARLSGYSWTKASVYRKYRHTALAKSAKIEEKARATEEIEVLYEDRHMWIDPVRVG